MIRMRGDLVVLVPKENAQWGGACKGFPLTSRAPYDALPLCGSQVQVLLQKSQDASSLFWRQSHGGVYLPA